MYKAVLVDLEEKCVRDISWGGGYEWDEIESFIKPQDRETEFYKTTINNVGITIFYACGAVQSRLSGWRIRDKKSFLFFSSAIFLPLEDTNAPYSNYFNTDCPLNALNVKKYIEWFDANEDFSVIVSS